MFKVFWVLSFKVQGLGFMVQGLGYRVQSLEFRVQGFKVQGIRFRARKMISYCTGQYRWNIPFQYLNRYRNKAKLYRPKYQGVPACFSCSGRFQSFSTVFPFPASINLNGVFLKKIYTCSNQKHQLARSSTTSSSSSIQPLISSFEPL